MSKMYRMKASVNLGEYEIIGEDVHSAGDSLAEHIREVIGMRDLVIDIKVLEESTHIKGFNNEKS